MALILPDIVPNVFLASFPAGPWQTNCYVVATGARQECIVIDPGFEAGPAVADVVAEHHLKPVAVVLTHGHLDHFYSVTPVCRDYAASCWIHGSDRELLTDPWRAMGPDSQSLVERLTGGVASFVEPDDVRELVDGTVLELAGLTLDVLHAPGHTPGSVMYRSGYPEPDIDSVVFSGDVLFAGSIGRTDLPGGDHAAMLESLRTKVLPLPDNSVVLPGHGPQTTIARERAGNPYLR
jgi:hydroxyacylglutathione hydrolase